jgi:hypothetical protein
MLPTTTTTTVRDDESDDGSDDHGKQSLKAKLEGFNEVPAVSTSGRGTFRAKISNDRRSIDFKLSYSGLEGLATAAHIHFGQADVNGGIAVFLCGGEGRPACPTSAGTVEGVIFASDVIGPSGQGIAPAEFAEFLRALRDGKTYANVHSDKHPSGEIRGKIR